MCLICNTIGIHDIILRPEGPKLKDWIDGDEDEARQPIWNKIRKNLTFYLGSAIEFASLRRAAEALFQRDYKDKMQIFVPEYYLSKDPSLIHLEKQKLETLLAARIDDDLTTKEKRKWECRLKSIEGEKLEKNVYDLLSRISS